MSKIVKNSLVFPVKSQRVLLGMKKRGFGAGWWNGFGGKLEPGENYLASAKRETNEETDLIVTDLYLVARLLFYFEGKLSIACEAFVTSSFLGTATETEEMRPRWFEIKELPFDAMWPGDEYWIPNALKLKPGDAFIKKALYFDKNNSFERFEEPDAKILAELF